MRVPVRTSIRGLIRAPFHTDPDIYFEASALLEGEQNFILPSADSEQAFAPKPFHFPL